MTFALQVLFTCLFTCIRGDTSDMYTKKLSRTSSMIPAAPPGDVANNHQGAPPQGHAGVTSGLINIFGFDFWPKSWSDDLQPFLIYFSSSIQCIQVQICSFLFFSLRLLGHNHICFAIKPLFIIVMVLERALYHLSGRVDLWTPLTIIRMGPINYRAKKGGSRMIHLGNVLGGHQRGP